MFGRPRWYIEFRLALAEADSFCFTENIFPSVIICEVMGSFNIVASRARFICLSWFFLNTETWFSLLEEDTGRLCLFEWSLLKRLKDKGYWVVSSKNNKLGDLTRLTDGYLCPGVSAAKYVASVVKVILASLFLYVPGTFFRVPFQPS